MIGYGRADKYDEPDLCAAWGGSGADKSDARMMMHALTEKRMGYAFPSMEVEQRPSLTEELEARGYDITTLRFSVEKKQCTATQTKPPANALTASQRTRQSGSEERGEGKEGVRRCRPRG